MKQQHSSRGGSGHRDAAALGAATHPAVEGVGLGQKAKKGEQSESFLHSTMRWDGVRVQRGHALHQILS